MVFELTPDYKITATPGVVKTGSIFLIMGVVLLVLLLLIMIISLLVWMTTSVTTITVLDPVKELCRGKWENGTCVCENGQSGANCNLQERGFYLYTGTVTTVLPAISQHSEDNLRECQEKCNMTEGCHAVQWERDTCSLLTNATLTAKQTVYAPATQHGLYVREISNAVFTDRAFLAARRVDIPNAYSQVISTKGFMQVFLESITTVPFLPRHISMPPDVTAIMSRNSFSTVPPPSDDVLYFTSSPKGEVEFPTGWNAPITVLFTHLQQA